MRVLHVISSLSSASGGPTMVASGIASAQHLTGNEASILCYESNDREFKVYLGDADSGNQVIRIARETGFNKFFAPSFYQRAHELALNAEILHLHGLWEPCLYAAARAAISAGTPFVLQPHGMLNPWAFNQRRLKKQLFYSIFQKKLVKQSAMLVASSRYEADCIRAFEPTALVRQVPNPIGLDELDPIPTRDAFHKLHPELQGKPYLLFLSRLATGKGLDLLADAFAKLIERGFDVRLVVIGNDYGAKEQLERQVIQLGIQDRVHILGPAYGRDKAAAFAGASCFCLASEHESFGLVIAEAMACRTPVVISDTCHFPEITETGAGIVTKREPNSIANAIERVLSASSAERSRMGEAGRTLVEEKFTYEAVGKASIVAYEQARSRCSSQVQK